MLEKTGGVGLCLAPVVHEALEILEEHVLVFVQETLDGISAKDEGGESQRDQE